MPDAPRQDSSPRGHDHRRFESLAVFATVVRTPVLFRVQLAYLLFGVAELAVWIALLVHAFDRGGATAAGLVAFAQLAPAVVFAPLGSALGDRMPRIRMLAYAYLAYGSLCVLVAVLVVADAHLLLVYSAAVIANLALTLVRPAQSAVLPTIARTPSELTAANVVSGTAENVGVFIGSVAGGILLGIVGTGPVLALSGALVLAGFAAVAGIRPAVAPTRRRAVELVFDPGPRSDAIVRDHSLDIAAASSTRAPAVATTASAGPPVRAPGGRGHGRRSDAIAHELLAGLRVIRTDPNTRVVVVVLALSMMLVGMLDVLGVVLALEALDAGQEGVGLLSGAVGAGGLLGAAFAISLVGRHRLLPPILAAALVVGLGIAASGIVPLLAVALAGFLAGGVGKSVFDVAGRTMLQRVAPEETLARVFGILEGLNMAALALGTLAAPLLVELLGTTAALGVAAVIVPVSVIALRPALARADRAGVVHERELELIRAIPMFAPLRVTTLERLAQELDHLHVPAGADVIREGDPGDRYFIIGAGRCEVFIGGRHINTIGPGDGFGEIALINDVPRTATVRAVDDLELFVLDRAPFLEAVTGQPRSRALAQELVDAQLAVGP